MSIHVFIASIRDAVTSNHARDTSAVHTAFALKSIHPNMIFFPPLLRGSWSAVRAAKNPGCAAGGEDAAAAGPQRVPAQTG